MSGIIGGVLGAFQAAGKLFGGYGLVTLGPVQFSDMEVPESINVGGKQQTTVFKLIGGARVIQALGRDDADLTWSGYFEGPGAESRAQMLDAIRISGQPIQLAFGPFSYTGLVSEFSGQYERTNWIPYSVTFQVLADNSAQPQTNQPSLLDSLNGDLNSAAGFDVSASVSSAISTAQVAVNVAGALGLKSTAWVNATAALGTASGLLQTAQLGASGTISGIVGAAGNVGNLLGITRVGNAAAQMTSALNAAATLSAATQALGFTGRAQTNLSNTSA